MGVSGVAAARLLRRSGASVRCSDLGADKEVMRRAEELKGIGCRVETGGHTERFARRAELAVISPGIDPSLPLLGDIIRAGVPVISEIELAFRFCKSRVIAVTGTNGKTTTVSLIERMLVEAGMETTACGNIGRAFSDIVAGATAPEQVVLEVSSFQLEFVREFKPHIAVALNIAEDHLDRYRDMHEYAKAKSAIFRAQGEGDWAVIRSGDVPLWRKFGVLGSQSLMPFGAGGRLGDGVYIREGRVVLAHRGRECGVCRMDEIRLTGDHNKENVMAAAAAAWAGGAGTDAIGRAVRDFGGLPHRMEEVATWKGVRFVNDSKATNPAAVIAALGAAGGPVVLIAGGRDKGFDYSRIRGEARRVVRAAVLIGEAREKIAAELAGATRLLSAVSLREAVGAAARMAQPGDTVLLSPACSSYDMFRNFEERGDEFRRSVRELMTNNKYQMAKK